MFIGRRNDYRVKKFMKSLNFTKALRHHFIGIGLPALTVQINLETISLNQKGYKKYFKNL